MNNQNIYNCHHNIKVQAMFKLYISKVKYCQNQSQDHSVKSLYVSHSRGSPMSNESRADIVIGILGNTST